MIKIEVSTKTEASKQMLISRLENVKGWSEWSDFTHTSIERHGNDGIGSVGEIRRLETKNSSVLEELLPTSGNVVLRYRLLKGLALKDYIASVEIEEHATYRHVTWSAQFKPIIPFTGWLFKRELSKFLMKTLNYLVNFNPKGH